MLASVAGMSSAFLGNKIYPIKGGMEPVKEEPVKEEPVKEEPVKEEPVKEEPVKEEPNPFKEQDTSQLGGDRESVSSSDSDTGGYRKYLRTARRNRYVSR
jgi:hypothetical protein